jgi:PIN domain nuclease of toxin-antitoxin system
MPTSFVSEVLKGVLSALPIGVQHGQLAGSLPGGHRDPFDRMLIAQALLENLLLVSNDSVFDGFGVHRYW